ncbi:MAG TPA: 3-deoxy-D-manno-octulosonate 8-phosphate phosphatase [Flavobacteriales bacterium]|nr:3-deoxy-D-manno-octulosonate 8-phosphate phosphatase [Flavobacteriales bacterium]HIA11043.1 3-deoxy-D-manno-octulosonate 8-phosphate phosphatase [Flavobacteriales bacterium]HIO71730.1 3-deoxy-D-manno-octulosonate 8-phosphate phosphatase [Flavobacteriales bacterium]
MSFLTSNLEHLKNQNGAISSVANADFIGKLDLVIEGAEASVNDLLSFSEFFDLSIDLLVKKDLKTLAEVSAKNIQLLVLDIDGVMTDGGMYYTEKGDEFKKFDTRDGVAIRRLSKRAFKVGIISSGYNVKLIQNRADLLGIKHVHTGADAKIETLKRWSAEMGIAMENIAFIGDDRNDRDAMEAVGISACPADADNSVKEIATIILSKKGGSGCIREFVDLYLPA